MNNEQLNRICEERINHLAPYIRTIPNEDMAQECRIGICKALKKEPKANNTYLKKRSQWQMIYAAKKGRSVDNGFWKRDKIRIVHYDHSTTDAMFLMIFQNRMTIPLEDLVIDKITMEGFFDTLTEIERMIVNYKLDGLSDRKTEFRLNITHIRFKRIRKELRHKIRLAFAD